MNCYHNINWCSLIVNFNVRNKGKIKYMAITIKKAVMKPVCH